MKLPGATAVSFGCAAAGAVAAAGTFAQYGPGHHGGEIGISVAIGLGWSILFALVGTVVGLVAMRGKTFRRRRLAQAAILLNLAVIMGVFASGACGR